MNQKSERISKLYVLTLGYPYLTFDCFAAIGPRIIPIMRSKIPQELANIPPRNAKNTASNPSFPPIEYAPQMDIIVDATTRNQSKPDISGTISDNDFIISAVGLMPA